MSRQGISFGEYFMKSVGTLALSAEMNAETRIRNSVETREKNDFFRIAGL